MQKIITIPIYYGKLVLFQLDDLKDIPKEFDPEFDTHGYNGLTWTHDSETGFRYFCMAFEMNTTQKIIAHESYHCLNNIFEHRGIQHDLRNDEPAAYLLGWIVERCHKYLKIKK